jgi:lysine 2,3-aminomutase
MEVTPEVREAITRLLSTGWIVTNQLVFTAAASRRGHSAKLRQVLNEVGVLPYYTFVVKGYRENQAHYTPVARAVQEELEEKVVGHIPERYHESVRRLPDHSDRLVNAVSDLRGKCCVPFLATDRTVLNLPAVGKSLTFRVIGITRYGRRILEFDHDRTRAHSPVIDSMGKVFVVESKSISEYMRQLRDMGEDTTEYEDIYGYSIGQTEPRMPVFEYPGYDFEVTDELTNFEMPSDNLSAPTEESAEAVTTNRDASGQTAPSERCPEEESIGLER